MTEDAVLEFWFDELRAPTRITCWLPLHCRVGRQAHRCGFAATHQQQVDRLVFVGALSPQQQFVKDPALDETIRARFSGVLEAAARGELFKWRRSARGRLAEIVVLDQFSRSVYRDTPRAFAQDAVALVLAQELVASGLDRELPTTQRAFAYLPYMHSESLQIHEQALVLYAEPGFEATLQFELRHKAILERFGRYPHRNAILGRPSTSEELAFLQEAGSSF